MYNKGIKASTENTSKVRVKIPETLNKKRNIFLTPPVFEEELWEFYEEDVYTSKTNNDSINLLETVEVNVYNPQQIEQCKRKIKSCQNCRGLCDGA